MTRNPQNQPWWNERIDGVGLDDPPLYTRRIDLPGGGYATITREAPGAPPALAVHVPEQRYTLDQLRALHAAFGVAVVAAERATAERSSAPTGSTMG